MAFFARLLRIAPARPATALERGTQALRAGRLDAAEAELVAARDDAATPVLRAQAVNKLALVALARGDRGAAQRLLALALELDPRCVAAIVNQGNLLLEDGRPDDAVAVYQRALAIDADSADAHHNLGVAYRRLGRRADSVRELRRATGLERRQPKQGAR